MSPSREGPVIGIDGDNVISKEEFLRVQRDVWQISAPEALESFTKLDTDGDGTMSRHEFIRAVREYFLSHDPHALGSVFFGRP
ncbi:EF-hand domain-containing protein [Streptomyces microflavus]|uniref:EF-hand domain-containing protein n=1 Tax=Streptomyces microflavus TaxID=1919 RepID=UPI0035D6A862